MSQNPSPTPPAPAPAAAKPVPLPVRPPAAPARVRRRHIGVVFSFFLMVLVPAALVGAYLWYKAADQFASNMGFSVRTEETSANLGILTGITGLSGSSSTDTDILFEFLQSQKLVATLDERLDLRAIWAKPEDDPFFTFDPSGSIEDLLDYWPSMVKIFYDNGAGLIEVQVRAFTPEDATRIAEELFTESSRMINELSAIAREDTIRYSREELAEAVERLKTAREAVTKFRNVNQLVDPSVDLQAQAGLLGNLESQLAEALIEVDLLQDTTRAADPRLVQSRRRVAVIEERIKAERSKLGLGGNLAGDGAMADVVGEYERLTVDREFAESSYITALAAYDASLAEAKRQSRYLGAYVEPTLAETSRFPERGLLLGLVGLFLFLGWAILVLVTYSLRDRR